MSVRILIVASLAVLVLALIFCRLRSVEIPAEPRARADAGGDLIERPKPSVSAEWPKSAENAPAILEEPAPVLVLPLPVQAGPLEWETRLERVATAPNVSESIKAKLLLGMLDSFPPEALETVARTAGELLPDSAYANASARLLNPQTHGRVLGVLFADLLERPDAIALPTLLALARNPAHPLAAAARENLELLLGQNLGTDWAKWDAEIHRTLK